MPVQILLLGISTSRRPTRLALRIRVNMSAMGSWLFIAQFVSDSASSIEHSAFPSLPACFFQSRNFSGQGELAKHDAGNLELAEHAAGAPGELAPVARARRARVA